jgi:hypothetical protein
LYRFAEWLFRELTSTLKAAVSETAEKQPRDVFEVYEVF